MKSEHDSHCEEMLDLLDPYLDGDLDDREEARLREHLQRCAVCAGELELAAKIQRELRSLPELDCPLEVLERVQRAGRGEVVPFAPPRRAMGLRIAAAAAVLSLAVGGGAWFLHLQQQRERPSPEEIAQAAAEARYAFAYIGKVTRRAGLDVRDEVFEKRLVAPAARSVSRSLGGNADPAAGASAARSEKEF
jgi:anti-sigma factor RsiW